MTILEEYQNFIRQLENRSLELEKHIPEEREQGIDQINQKLDTKHILHFENDEYKVRTYLRDNKHKGNYTFSDGKYYYNHESGIRFNLKFMSKWIHALDKEIEQTMENDINGLKAKIETLKKEKDSFSNLAKTANCAGSKPIDIREFFIDLFQLNIKISNDLKLYLFGKFIAQNCNLYKENIETISKMGGLLRINQY